MDTNAAAPQEGVIQKAWHAGVAGFAASTAPMFGFVGAAAIAAADLALIKLTGQDANTALVMLATVVPAALAGVCALGAMGFGAKHGWDGAVPDVARIKKISSLASDGLKGAMLSQGLGLAGIGVSAGAGVLMATPVAVAMGGFAAVPLIVASLSGVVVGFCGMVMAAPLAVWSSFESQNSKLGMPLLLPEKNGLSSKLAAKRAQGAAVGSVPSQGMKT
jgi:hypothetical protein